MATDKNIIRDIEECYDECFSAENLMHLEFEEDDGFYLGGLKQWNANDIALMNVEITASLTEISSLQSCNIVLEE